MPDQSKSSSPLEKHSINKVLQRFGKAVTKIEKMRLLSHHHRRCSNKSWISNTVSSRHYNHTSRWNSSRASPSIVTRPSSSWFSSSPWLSWSSSRRRGAINLSFRGLTTITKGFLPNLWQVAGCYTAVYSSCGGFNCCPY